MTVSKGGRSKPRKQVDASDVTEELFDSPAELAGRLGMARHTVAEWARKGAVKAVKPSGGKGRWLIAVDAMGFPVVAPKPPQCADCGTEEKASVGLCPWAAQEGLTVKVVLCPVCRKARSVPDTTWGF